MELKGKTVVLTGASAGIGAATALDLSNAGCNLVLTSRRLERLEALAATLPGPSALLAADIAEPDVPEQLLALAKARFGRADVVINNAGVMAVGTMDTIDLDAVSYMIRVNFEAVVRSSYVFAREFRGQSSGAIINVSSISAYLISRAGGVYGGLKHALEAFTQSLRIELAGAGVKVGSIAPGSTSSEMFDRMMAAAKIEDPVALDPKDIARAIRFMLEQPDHATIARLAIYPQSEAH
ncbi:MULTISPECIES: SDR family oxidoreductase [unclassified Caulobacter]|jgi:NADP-dependent 3-hydroxy acid dehydrogenase YdfG|uniref:SDR family oxidoreductase n=1 Tax=unclassified Caulobacter TaxID=2648921 RepID=UPI0007856093|nr:MULTISPECIES: SDR family oxidoreductase [unclassified Caulobacter]AZS19310.1 SDR family oxidoreductase [Caulobacter sp. FWC26]